MIIEQNVPTPVRTWAYCQDMTRHYEKLISILEAGSYFDMGTRGIYVDAIKRYGSAGKKKYLENYCKPESERLRRRCTRYRALADRIQQESEIPLENWLLSKEEALNLIGETLRYKNRGRFRRNGEFHYITLQSCSGDGERIFCSNSLWPNGLDSLLLLSLGFGKAL